MAGLHLYYAHQLETLVDRLSEHLKPRLGDPALLFTPVDVLVPNDTMRAWLEHAVARRLGITPNMRVRRLRRFLADRLSVEVLVGAQPMRPEILGRAQLHHILFELLKEAHLEVSHGVPDPLPDCGPIRDYLRIEGEAGNPQTQTARERRLYQLTRELARIFIEYSFSRSTPIVGPPLEPAPFLADWERFLDTAPAELSIEDDGATPVNTQLIEGLERWQRSLWRLIFEPGGRLEQINAERARNGRPPLMTLVQAFKAFRDANLAKDAPDLPERIYLFGFPHIARLFSEAVGLLSESATVEIFALTPSVIRAAALSSGSQHPENEREPHALLRLWGVADAEHARMWASLRPEVTCLDGAKERRPASLLGVLQDDIAWGDADSSPGRPAEFHQNDQTAQKNAASLHFMECHAIAREVEAVADRIWVLLENSRRAHQEVNADSETSSSAHSSPEHATGENRVPFEALRADEIAVVIAGADQHAYQSQIEEVFSGHHGLRRTWVGLAPPRSNRALEAVQLLLALPFGRFRRDELLQILVHPNLRGHLEPDSADAWGSWAERLGIIFAADRDEQADTYLSQPTILATPGAASNGVDMSDGGGGEAVRQDIAHDRAGGAYHWDILNWDQGLRRLILGAFLSGARSGVNDLFKIESCEYLPLETPEANFDEAARFSVAASSLIADARWLRDGDRDELDAAGAPIQRTVHEWAELLEEYLNTYLHVRPASSGDHEQQRKADGYYLGAARRIMRQIARDCPVDGAVSYRVFYEFARDALRELAQRPSHYLTGGVVVSTSSELRGLPFEHIFVVGLGEGQFPDSYRENALDLRARDLRPGDLSSTDRDRYAFLETLLAARRSLTLSWVAHESTTGEPLNASSVVNELRWVLADRFCIEAPGDGEPDVLTTRHKLRRFHEDYFPDAARVSASGQLSLTHSLHPAAREEALLHRARREVASNHIRRFDLILHDLRALTADTDAWPTLRRALKLLPLPSPSSSASICAPGGRPTVPGTMQSGLEGDSRVPGTMQISVGGDLSEQMNREDDAGGRRCIRIRLSALRKFLETPLQGAARFQLGLEDDEEDIFGSKYESLSTSRLNEAILLRRVVAQMVSGELGVLGVLDGRGQVDEALVSRHYDDVLLPHAAINGQLPGGHFLLYERAEHLQTLRHWCKNLRLFGVDSPLESVEIGQGQVDGRRQLEAIQFDLILNTGARPESVRVELYGEVPWHARGGEQFIWFQTGKGSKKYLARAMAEVAAVYASGLRAPDEALEIVMNPPKSFSDRSIDNFRQIFSSWHAIEPHRSPLEYLRDLSAELLGDTHDYLMPIDYALTKPQMRRDDCTTAHLDAWIRKKLGDPYARFTSQHGPIKDYPRFGAPRDARVSVADLLEQRFPNISWKS